MITRKLAIGFNVVTAEFLPHLKRWTVVVDISLASKVEVRRGVHVAGTLEDNVTSVAEAAVSKLAKGEGFYV